MGKDPGQPEGCPVGITPGVLFITGQILSSSGIREDTGKVAGDTIIR